LGSLAFYILILKFGDFRPGFLPSSQNLPQIIEKQSTGEAVDMPLKLPVGYKIGVFADNTGIARDLQFSPGGTLLVSIPDSGRVSALPDKNNDGRADEVKTVLSGLTRPHGLAFHQGKLYVAELRQLARYSWDEENLTATREKVLFAIPYNGGHSTRSIVVKPDGTIFVSVGSSCNVCSESSQFLASVITSDIEGGNLRLFAKGLRNTVFMALNPETGEIWGGDMGRDLLGDNVPPEEINIVRDGKDYGWPICYDNRVHDTNFDKKTYIQDPCAGTEAPTYRFQAHSAPLGLTFINSVQFPDDWQGDILISYHGSWNRSVPTGFKVVRMKVEGNTITGEEDFLTGFLQGAEALGRPVDLIFDAKGSLYLSDDKAGGVYKIVRQ
jgi:glucose/arabinose dehydrogenase